MEVGRLIRLAVVGLCICVTAINMAEAGALGRWYGPGCLGVSFVTRAEWGARPPKSRLDMPDDLGFVVVHHTGTQTCTDSADCSRSVRQIQKYHMDNKGYEDIGYNFLIGGDTRVYVGRGWNTVGTQAGNKYYNRHSIGISLFGVYTDVLPSREMIAVLLNLIDCGVYLGHLNENYVLRGHRDVRVKPTECPGERFYQEIRGWYHYR